MYLGMMYAPRRQVGSFRHFAGFAGNVHGAVAHAQHNHVFVPEDVVVHVVVGMKCQSIEFSGEGRFWIARVPVVAVGDNQCVVVCHLAVIERNDPHAIIPALGPLEAGLEPDA